MILNVKVDAKDFVTYITKLRARSRTVPFKHTKQMAQRMKQLMIGNLTPSWPQGSGHNTPSLRQNLHFRKTPLGHNVFFDEGVGALPVMVEEGTKPHEQPNNPFFRKRKHPGAKPKHFFSKSYNTFASEFDGQVVHMADDIVRGTG